MTVRKLKSKTLNFEMVVRNQNGFEARAGGCGSGGGRGRAIPQTVHSPPITRRRVGVVWARAGGCRPPHSSPASDLSPAADISTMPKTRLVKITNTLLMELCRQISIFKNSKNPKVIHTFPPRHNS